MSKPLGPGDLCAVELGDADYRVVKILAMEDGIVHVRLYADDESFGIQHLPVSAEDFATWRPGAVGHEEVRAEELEAYELWQEAYEGSRSQSGRARA